MVFAARLALMMLAASGELSHEESLREELRVGTGLAVNAPNDAVSATEVIVASLGGSWAWRGNRLSALYDPTLQFPDFPNLGVSGYELLHAGRLADDYALRGGRTHLGVAEDFQYGTTDLFTLTQVSATGPPVVQAVPVIIALNYLNSSAVARVQSELTPRLKLDVSGGYQVSGGADAAAQAILPLQKGPVATALLDYRLSRLDTLSSTLTGLEADFSGGQRIWLVEATEGETHRFNRELQARLDLGWGTLSERAAFGTPFAIYNFPVARLTLTETDPLGRDSGLVLSLASELAPYIDRITANGYEHFQVYATGEWTVLRGFGANLQVGYSDPLYGDLTSSQSVVTANGRLFYEPVKFLRLEAGAIGVWQQPQSGAWLFQWITFFGVTLKDAGML